MSSILEQARTIRASMNTVAATLDDSAALENLYIFPLWSGGAVSYAVGDKVRLGDTLYRCLTAHTSQPDWAPGAASSLWARMDDPAEEWPEWVRPVGAHDAYSKGAKVSHGGKHWVSDVDANVWEPGVSQWTEVTEQ